MIMLSINTRISHLFEENGVEQYVEVAGTYSKLGIINRFHRTLRDMLKKVMIVYDSKRWIDFIDGVIHNYNNRVHRTLGKSPISMTRGDVTDLNRRLTMENQESKRRLNSFKVGDQVRYLVQKSIFGKGGKTFSTNIYTVTEIEGYNIKIERGDSVMYVKYWELLKV